MNLRGIIALTLTCLGLLVLDLIQRLVIAPAVWLAPAWRSRLLGRWIHVITWVLLTVPRRIGGARIPDPPRIPCEPGVLILMNHQSLFDIPLVAESVEGGYPLIVTRQRYARWIPTISKLIRLYKYPVVNPLASPGTLRGMVKELINTARTAEVPLAVFPEGTRTDDGEIGALKAKGLALVLRARPWKVYVLVIDGFWRVSRFKDLLSGISKTRGRLEVAGVLEWTDPRADPGPFTDRVHTLMVDHLEEMRGARPFA